MGKEALAALRATPWLEKELENVGSISKVVGFPPHFSRNKFYNDLLVDWYFAFLATTT